MLTIPADHPAFDGHFPGDPVLPGVVILEAVLAAIEAAGEVADGCIWSVAKFHAPARPGDRLEISLVRRQGSTFGYTVDSDGRRIADGSVTVRGGSPR